ncbi:hypothetical protein M5689_012730 [Euphorbia peplus]|nr:hypothetical protein M5689_012730 [Euphorbia peplus]
MAIDSCFCGEQSVLKISWRETNLGRRFYGGCKYGGKERSCGYFHWFNDPLEDHYHHVMAGLLTNLRNKDEEIKEVGRRCRQRLWLKLVIVFMIGLICGILL